MKSTSKLESSSASHIDSKSFALVYTRFTFDDKRDQLSRQCPNCRQGTVIGVVSQSYLKLCKPFFLPMSKRMWRCSSCAWKTGVNSRVQPPVVARPFSFDAVREVNPMHRVAESWHRPPSIVEQQSLTLPTIHLTR